MEHYVLTQLSHGRLTNRLGAVLAVNASKVSRWHIFTRLKLDYANAFREREHIRSRTQRILRYTCGEINNTVFYMFDRLNHRVARHRPRCASTLARHHKLSSGVRQAERRYFKRTFWWGRLAEATPPLIMAEIIRKLVPFESTPPTLQDQAILESIYGKLEAMLHSIGSSPSEATIQKKRRPLLRTPLRESELSRF